MKVIAAACHQELEPHLHAQDSGWTRHAALDKPIRAIRVDLHDPTAGTMEGVTIVVDAP